MKINEASWKTAAALDTLPAMFEAWCDLVWDAVEKKAKLPKEVKAMYANDSSTENPFSHQLNIEYKTAQMLSTACLP